MEHQAINNFDPHPFWIWFIIIVSLLFCSIRVKASDTTRVVYVVETSSEYCKGYLRGFSQGYCYEEQWGCISPVPPPCPIPRINEEQTYKAGYNRGFVLGRKKYKKDHE